MKKLQTLIGFKLLEIHRKEMNGMKLVEIIFENPSTHHKYGINFEGHLFETPISCVGKIVEYIDLTNWLGFRALCEVRNENLDEKLYEQLFIKMEGSDIGEGKIELIGACKDIAIFS